MMDKERIAELEEAVKSLYREMFRLFEDAPDENGFYFHLGICSGSRRKPIGASGCCCKNAKIFKRLRNPHDWVLLEKTRIPERGLMWDSYKCVKCGWTATYNPDLDIDELNKMGWCPEE